MKLSSASARPLDTVTASELQCAKLKVRDGRGREYVARAVASGECTFRVAGAPGAHVVSALDADGRVVETSSFRVACRTALSENTGTYARLLDMLHDTMFEDWHSGYAKTLRYKGKWYKYYVSWLRDHVHTLKGMKYFDDDIKTGIDLYADTQREDGMIWDKVKKMYHSDLQTWRDVDFAEGDFIRPMEGHPQRRLTRIPVENDVEFLYLEGLYYTWKACGDDEWMKGLLDSAIKAVSYSTSDAYRWSEQYRLLKRGYTIDTWDFQHADDARRSGSVMRIDLEKTEFNVFHGDNTGMAVGCEYLAEMLDAAGRPDEAAAHRRLAGELRERLNDLSWNGSFYTHMIPENPEAERDLGATNPDGQVTLSNAYALNRNIGHDKAAAIVRSYQRIREDMPKTSAGEFYNCYPPFEKGYGRHTGWNYMNGGVSTICAGELAHGAFEHGFESYGVDILDRLHAWAVRLGGYLHTCLKGALPEETKQDFAFVDLRAQANADFRNDTDDGVVGWFDERNDNDMREMPLGRRAFHGIEFDIIDPKDNARRGCIVLGAKRPFAPRATVPVGRACKSLYLLHTANGGDPVGWFTARYDDGSHATQYVRVGREVYHWFMPAPYEANAGGNKGEKRGNLLQAWNGPNKLYTNVGFSLYGWNNPHPDKTVAEVEFVAAEGASQWAVLGLTTSDTGVQLPVSPVSYGIPDMWGCAAVVYALLEGLGGVKDTGVAYDTALLAPRWSASGVTDAELTVHLPASNGYVTYRYQRKEDAIRIEATSTADAIDVQVLLPEGTTAGGVTVNGDAVEFDVTRMEQSRYACTRLTGIDVFVIDVALGKDAAAQ